MYKTIILTLDRSELAEQAIPHAVALAQAFKATIEIITVVPVIDRDAMIAAGVAVNWEAEVKDAEDYVSGVRTALSEEGVVVHSEVRRGEIAEEILRHCEEMDAEMIVMSTHGRSGFGRWVYGSVADRVLRKATVPILLVRAVEE